MRSSAAEGVFAPKPHRAVGREAARSGLGVAVVRLQAVLVDEFGAGAAQLPRRLQAPPVRTAFDVELATWFGHRLAVVAQASSEPVRSAGHPCCERCRQALLLLAVSRVLGT